jgi:HK97 family phage prohead protease
MKFKDLKLNLTKTITDKGEFEGYASTFGNEDLGGDIVEQGAFAKTIAENKNVPILWGHNVREVIGVNKDFSEDAKGLFVKGQLILDVQRARETHALMKGGAVKGLSIGYDAIRVDYSRAKEGIRILSEVKLYEYSVTAFPMNEAAQVTDIKSDADVARLLSEFLLFKGTCPVEHRPLLDEAIEKLSALRAAKAPEAATQQNDAPELFHPSLDRLDSISKILRGV